MDFKQTYASESDKAENKVGKKVVSDEAFLLGELLTEIIKSLRASK